MKKSITIFGILLFVATMSVRAQVAEGGNYKLEQTVIAAGGNSQSNGDNYSVDGTSGQSAATTNALSGGNYSMRIGFWTPPAFATTAAGVTVSGRVLNLNGNGIFNAVVMLTNAMGEMRSISTNNFGNYEFTDVTAGEIYVFTVSAKMHRFAPQAVNVGEQISELNFYAQP